MTLASSPALHGFPSSPSSSPSDSASSRIPSGSPQTLSLVERIDERAKTDGLRELAAALLEMENIIHASHAASARVATAFAQATNAEGLSPLIGHQFVAQISRVGLHLSDALTHSADGHRVLRKLATQLGYDVTAYGDTNCPPKDAFVRNGSGPVSNAA